jgi:hypothetical protein
MAMTSYSGDTSVIGKLGTTPQERGLTTQQFKDKFDEGLKTFVEWFNTTHKAEFEALEVDTTGLMPKTGGTFTGVVKAQNNNSHTTAQIRNIILSPDEADAELMGNGDIWIKYTDEE